MDREHTKPSESTSRAERADARVPAGPDRMPTPEEEQLAEELELDPEVAEHYEEMMERGARQRGEGRIP